MREVLLFAVMVVTGMSSLAEQVVDVKIRGYLVNAPATVMVTVRVPPDARNRALAVMADSGDFSRRSTIELDGEYDAPVHQMWFKELPEGDYVVTAEVLGADGVRGYAQAELRVLGHLNPKGGR
jgi:hypothetical protein